MAKQVSSQERQRIVAAIKAGDACGAIAREFARSKATISGIAASEGLSFERSATKDATAAREADIAEQRSRLRGRLLACAEEMLDRLAEATVVYDFTKDGEFVTGELAKPPAGDARNFMTAAAVAIDKSLALDRHDNAGQGLAAVDLWLRSVTGEATPTG